MTKLPTVAEAKAALEAAEAALGPTGEAYRAAAKAAADASHAVTRAKRALGEARDRESVNSTARARRKAQALAKQYGITIEREHYGDNHYNWWVLGPDAIYGGGFGPEHAAEEGFRADPCHGSHVCGGWHEVLGNVETYVEDILKMPPNVVALRA